MNTSLMPRELALFEIIRGLMAHFKKLWCYPAQLTILKHLETDHGIIISLRTLNRDLARMEEKGIITRQRRHDVHPKIGKRFRSTLYEMGSMAPWLLGKLKRLLGRLRPFNRLPEMAKHLKDVTITNKSRPSSIGSILEVLRI